MGYILVVFTQRKDAYQLYQLLLSQGYPAKIVNTPRELSASCGISVRAGKEAYRAIERGAGELRSLVAVYWYTVNSGYRRIG